MNDLVERLHERAESYRQGGPSSEHTAVMLEQAASRISQQEAELERLKAVIAWANNSLFGSHGFFLSLTLGAHDEHHLDRAIEDLKARARNAETENATLKAGIKRLSEEEELISETGSDEALTAVHLAARLAEAEELARVMEAEANQLREVSISNRHRAEAAEANARAMAFVEVEKKAREWADHYHTLILFAEWAQRQASLAKAEDQP